MSGHSHSSTIKREKDATDQKRGQIFSKLAKAIALAVGDGPDPQSNFKLRLAVERAKNANMPKENIERAIASGQRKSDGMLEEVIYEGYGPEGVAVLLEAVTDNRNRTTAEIKNIFERGGGSLASPGALSFQFKKIGLIKVKKIEKAEEQILNLIDLGVEDVNEKGGQVWVFTLPEQLKAVEEKIKANGFEILEAELVRTPVSPVKQSPEKEARINAFIKNLLDHEDIQKVYTNQESS